MAEKRKLWFTRTDNKIRGPFPSATIQASLLLGRLSEEDEVSDNQIIWHAIKNFPELIPAELKADLSVAQNRENLRMARLRVDERQQEDRRSKVAKGEKLRGDERRQTEDAEDLAVRRARVERKLRERERKPENYTVRFSILICFIASILWLAFSTGNSPIIANVGCNIQSEPTIIWDNCRMDGIELPGEDLAHASMVNASLTGADFSNSRLVQADMSYANLTGARLIGAQLTAARLKGVNFRNAGLKAANMQSVNLEFAILHGADLGGANLQNANLKNVDFRAANLDNADLTGATLDKAIWTDNSVCAPQSVGRCLPLK